LNKDIYTAIQTAAKRTPPFTLALMAAAPHFSFWAKMEYSVQREEILLKKIYFKLKKRNYSAINSKKSCYQHFWGSI